MDGRAGRQGFRFFAVCCIEQGRAEGLALEHGFFGDFADRMWDDRCVVMGFVEGFSCIFQGLDIFFRLDGDSQFKGLGFQVPAAFHLLDEFVGFGALVSANDDDRDTAQVDGLTGDVVDVIFVEGCLRF